MHIFLFLFAFHMIRLTMVGISIVITNWILSSEYWIHWLFVHGIPDGAACLLRLFTVHSLIAYIGIGTEFVSLVFPKENLTVSQ